LLSSHEVFQALKSHLAGQQREQFLLVALNTKNEILRVITVSIGSLSQSLVHPREVFREAIRESAATVMLVHNHPSGDPYPSRDDEQITQRLARAGDLLGIRVLDHIIIGRERYFSFADEGRLGVPPG
jgi:DNA repair protein RadC